jgi:hypothetical protein
MFKVMRWSESIAAFIETVKSELGIKALHRKVAPPRRMCCVKRVKLTRANLPAKLAR